MARKKSDPAARKPKPKPKNKPSPCRARARQEEYNDTRMPWDRARGESDQAFEAFKAYRDMGLERSTPKVAAEVHKSIALIRRWSAEWKWKERIEAWDVEQDRIERQQNLVEVKKMRKRHADTGMLLIGKALQKLARIDPAFLSSATLVKFIELGAKLEARARGEPEEHVQQDHSISAGQRPIQSFTICGKTIEF